MDATNSFANSSATPSYNVALEYDQNDNILHLDRNGLNPSDATATSLQLDQLTYIYETEGTASGATRSTNRLLAITDPSSSRSK